ncbi:MAG TPA: hypothetical protein VE650_02435 [Acetobacteraceae bacterium]|nr:hypothetical protein [Acetobacteraceae bacterium]
MQPRSTRLLLATGLIAALGTGASGLALAQSRTQAPGTTVAYTTDLVATVESIDQNSRHIVLRGPNGGRVSLVVGPAVENLAKVKAGDKVRVHYIEALAASLAKPGSGNGGSTVTEQTGISRGTTPGGNPTGTVGSQVRSTVVVQGVDRRANTVTFIGPDNVAETTAVHDPDAQRFIATLNPGDRVDVVYTESLALALEPQRQ